MKPRTRSSITLPPAELKLVVALQTRLKVKSKVEVVRRGFQLLKELQELEELDHLAAEGLKER